ncbi:MAG: hypothetical protein WCB19_05775 [Thermoplasmata archaeon]
MAAGASAAAGSVLIGRISERWHQVIQKPNERVKDALIWTLYMAPRDADGESWTEEYLKLIREKILSGQQFTPGQFAEWVTTGSNQWRRKLQLLGNDYLQLIPLANWLSPGENQSFQWLHPDGIFVRDLAIEGRRKITTGLVGSGKTESAIWDAEQLAKLKDDLVTQGPASWFARSRRSRVQARIQGQDEEVEESQLDAGQPMKRLGLWDARGIGFVANFSIRDNQDGRFSPIKDRWKVHPTFSGMLKLIAENLRRGIFTHFITDEAGLSIDRNLATSYIMKTWKDLGRMTRKVNVSWHLLTQHEKTDFDDDMLNDSTCFVRMIGKENGKGPKGSFYTIPGALNDEYLTDIPRCVSGFDTADTPGTIVDVRMGDVVNYMARRQSEVEAKGNVWGVSDRVDALLEGLRKFALSEEEMYEISRNKMGRLVA